MKSLIAWMRRPRCIHVTVERYNLKRQDTQNIRQAREGRDEELWKSTEKAQEADAESESEEIYEKEREINYVKKDEGAERVEEDCARNSETTREDDAGTSEEGQLD